GPRLHPCLDAFMVALNQSCDGKSWYTSTKELQLASLTFCGACRSVTTLTLKVDVDMPRSLMAAADAPAPSPKRLCATRVPRLRARRVVWEMPTAEDLRRPTYAMNDAIEVEIRPEFADSLEGVIWPHRLSLLELNCFSHLARFNQPLDEVRWPASLRRLTLGGSFRRSLQGLGTQWPASLRRLDNVRHGLPAFDQAMGGVRWPRSLRRLSIGGMFRQPLQELGHWPYSIRDLSFGETFNQPIEGVTWPTELQTLSFGVPFDDSWFGTNHLALSAFDQAMDRVRWPIALRRLSVGGLFRHSLQELGRWIPSLEELRVVLSDAGGYHALLGGIEWPKHLSKLAVAANASLEEIAIPASVEIVGVQFGRPDGKAAFPATPRHFTSGHSFDQGLKRIVWPASLQQLTFGKSFHQPIENVVFPQSLQQLTLGHQFNHPIHRVQWPASLRRLTFGTHFDQEIGGVTWPNSLTKLTFGVFFNKTLQGVVLPVSLAELTLGSCFQQPIEGVTWPNSLRQLEFGRYFNQPVEKVNWPKALRTLSFECDSDHPFWYGLWPPLESRFDQPLDSARWPLSLRRLSVGGYFNQSLQGLGTWMPNLEELRLVLISGWTYRILLGGIEWPKGLRDLTVAAGACLQGVAIPPTVKVVYVEKKRYGT
ncbi:unnamed protein product, partial [Scytosiphon promiscuus]